jgi:CHAP domain
VSAVRGVSSRGRARLAALLAGAVVVCVGVSLTVADAAPAASAARRTRGTAASEADSPAPARLSALRVQIVALALSELGYTTDPADSYCNQFSAFWGVGDDDCPDGGLDEEWCADFAAWVWNEAAVDAGVAFPADELSVDAVNFYEWGVANGTWHPVDSGYVPQAGDVALYGLDVPDGTADHVAIVIGYDPGKGPDVINGNDDVTAFSDVEFTADQMYADTYGPDTAPLSGYVSPPGA